MAVLVVLRARESRTTSVNQRLLSVLCRRASFNCRKRSMTRWWALASWIACVAQSDEGFFRTEAEQGHRISLLQGIPGGQQFYGILPG